MATKSFLKDVHINGKKQAYDFIRALETSKQKPEKTVIMSRSVSDMTVDEMHKLFEQKRTSSDDRIQRN